MIELDDRAALRTNGSSLRAGLANIPDSIVQLAQTKASAFERWVTLKRILFNLKKATDDAQPADLLQFLSKLKLD